MPYKIKARLATLEKTNVDVTEEMRKRGFDCSRPEFSAAIGKGKKQPKHYRILELANVIITEWENVAQTK